MSQRTIEQTLTLFDERFYRVRPQKAENDAFGENLKTYIQKMQKCIQNNETEEHIKAIINTFLKDNFYLDTKIYEINSSGYTDSTIRINGVDNVMIEVKKHSNKNEMISRDNINKKALWELTYYFLSETRKTDRNKVSRNTDSEIKHLIITDALTWLIVDATELDRICDGFLEKEFWKYENNKLTYAKNTAKFYQEIKEYFDKIDITNKLNYTIFNISEIYSKKPQWKYLYKILSKEFLLKEGYNVEPKTNVLNDKFYHELLYIMGLKEQKTKNSVVIEIDHSIKNSLANQVYNIYVNDKGYDGSYRTKEEAIDKTFELIIIWINRLLFIKLFEGQLIAFNSDSSAYKILDNSKIKSFQDLQNLFFFVLGRRTRGDEDFYKQFSEIPYLNSSLFEQQPIERNDININAIHNLKIARSKRSILGKRTSNELLLLEYIINFLNSYDFSSQVADEERPNRKREIIDASVLGLIFEKLNGYKDGAVYTPSVIAEYMCKYTIEKSVIDNINKHFNWKCSDFDEIKFNITSPAIAKEINEVINSIKICDPAVGSGHFLVSALNRIIAIKAQLGVLFKYGTNERLYEVDIFVLEDILRVTDGQDNDFVYNKENRLSQQIQETLFNEKRMIIEDMLFGVDINPKAVYICQLRLWIELLKNAYYKRGIMETLPNIDINIKSGNSLLSNFKFNVGEKITILEDSDKKSIKQYKEAVKRYKSTSEKNDKILIRNTINSLKISLQ